MALVPRSELLAAQLERLAAKGLVGWDRETGELVDSAHPSDRLFPFASWPDHELHGFACLDLDCWMVPRALHKQANTFDPNLEPADVRWKRIRARLQHGFRRAALAASARCVACGSAVEVEAAHPLQHATKWASEFDSERAHHPCLAVTLCHSCHGVYDGQRWPQGLSPAAIEQRMLEHLATRRGVAVPDVVPSLYRELAADLLGARRCYYVAFEHRRYAIEHEWRMARAVMLWYPPVVGDVDVPRAIADHGEWVTDLTTHEDRIFTERQKSADFHDRLEACRSQAAAQEAERAAEELVGLQQAILETLAANPNGLRAVDIANALRGHGASESKIYYELNQRRDSLCARGLVRRLGSGRGVTYALVTAGDANSG